MMRSIKNEGKTKRVRELQTLDHLLKVESKPRKKSGFPMYDVRQRPANRFGGIFDLRLFQSFAPCMLKVSLIVL